MDGGPTSPPPNKTACGCAPRVVAVSDRFHFAGRSLAARQMRRSAGTLETGTGH